LTLYLSVETWITKKFMIKLKCKSVHSGGFEPPHTNV